MLTIVVPGDEYFDDDKSEFVTHGDVTLHFEHSLVSLSKWESIFEKPFLTKEPKTDEEALRYLYCMVQDDDFPPDVFTRLTEDNRDQINKYLEAKQTATWFNDRKKPSPNQEVITSELIYYWLTVFKIPFSVETWHLNRLFTLIRVCNVKNAPVKKMSPSEIAARNRELNAQRRAQLGTKG